MVNKPDSKSGEGLSREYFSSDWRDMRIKNVATVLRGGSPRPIEDYLTDDEDGLNWIKIGDTKKGYKYISSTSQKIKRSGLSKTRMVHAGDLLLTNSMSFGEPYILAIDGCIHDGWVCLSDIRNVMKEYLYYYLCSDYCKNQFKLQVAGGVVQNLNVDKIGSTRILVPPLAEQEAIVKFLNDRIAEIDSVIEEAKTTIEEYKSWKASIIYETVTKGLDKNVEMKDSGVKWIGVMPVAWDVCALKQLTTKIGSGKTPSGGAEVYSDSGIMFIRSQNVYNTGLILDEISYITEEIDSEMSNTRVQFEDVLLNITGGSIGRCCIYDIEDKPANVNQHVCILRTDKKKLLPQYLRYFWNSASGPMVVDQYQTGGNRQGLNFQQIGMTKIPLCSLEEQGRIVEYLNLKCHQIDTLISEKQSLISDLESYKKSLIFETVTGKRKVV